MSYYDEAPPGIIPSYQLTDAELMGLGMDPTYIRMMEAEMAEMGLGLGFSLKSLVKGITKPFTTVAKGVYAGGKFVATKAVPTVVKTAIKVAPIALPVAGAAALALRFGPGLVSRAAQLLKKPAAQLTEADVAQVQVQQEQAQAIPTPAPTQTPLSPLGPGASVAPMVQTWYNQKTGAAVVAAVPPEKTGWALTPPAAGATKQKSDLLSKLKSLVERTAPLVPQVVEAVAPQRPAFPEFPQAAPQPGTSISITSPGAPAPDQGGAAPSGGGGGMPGWLVPAGILTAFVVLPRLMGGRARG